MGRPTPAFEALIVRALSGGEPGEPYVLSRAGAEALVQGFLELSAGPEARAEVEAALRWVVALDTRLDSPGAADRLRSIVRAEPNAAPHLSALSAHAPGAIDGYRAFLEAEGRSAGLAAPPVPDPADPPGEEGSSPGEDFSSPLYAEKKKRPSSGRSRLRRGKFD